MQRIARAFSRCSIGGWADEQAGIVKLCAAYGAPMRHARATPAFREHAISRQRAFQIGKLAMLFRR
jgi:hypothetical protein